MVRTLDGTRFADVVRAGALAVVRERALLDRINVFPVPDADTGANLAATLRAAARLGDTSPSAIGAAARLAADAALDGARGNSGAIFAQFLHGMAESVRDRLDVGTSEFAAAARQGSDAAYLALQEPREGTILSVVKAWAHELIEHADEHDDFVEVLGRALAAARRALADTPKQLAVLARNHVVDAGGQGFVFFLEGVLEALRCDEPVVWPVGELPEDTPAPFAEVHADLDTTYRFCSEVLLSGEGLDREVVMAAVSGLGGSLVVAGAGSRMRVHLHTNMPRAFLDRAAGLGTIERSKVDDMILQQLAGSAATIAIVTDSTCDLPEDIANRLGVVSVPLAVTIDGHTYRDGVDMTALEFYRRMRAARELPKSSQPAVADFVATYERLLEHHEGIVSLHIAGALSGTVQAAAVAAQAVDPARIRVIDSCKVSVGSGLLVEAVAEAIRAGVGLDEVERRARATRPQIKVLGTTSTLEYAVRGGRVSPRAARLIESAHLYPIIAFSDEGKAGKGGASLGFNGALRAIVRRALRFAGDGPARAMVVHTDALEAAETVAERLASGLGVSDVPVVRGGPVVATHVGLGCVSLAVRRLESAPGA